ncbi:MAG: CHAT domain-containing protein [bacterium]|jgi:CHAT domain-containing protein/Tol biopolymer transport system component|nr:CHAT domain-containing protein [candidate division KSB1 bacterium]MDH7559623.1 CHAT domain-containing protein [bacterium]
MSSVRRDIFSVLPLLWLLASPPPCALAGGQPLLPHQVTTHPADDLSPALSPDGKWVAFTSTRSGNQDVWVRPVHGGKAYQITTHQADDYCPAWSRNGDRLVFVSKRSDAAGDIWMVELRRTGKAILARGEPVRLTDYLGEDAFPSFSPDGTEVAFCSDRTGRTEIWVLRLKPRSLTRVTWQGGKEPNWSPDGTWLVYTAFDSLRRNGTIAVTPAHPDSRPELPKEVPITDGSWFDCQPAWSPTGHEVVFCRFPYDTNHDGRITPDDNPVIVRAAVSLPSSPSQLPSAPRELQVWLTSGTDFAFGPNWASGELVCYASDRSGNLDIWAVPADGLIPRHASAMGQLSYARDAFPLPASPLSALSAQQRTGLYERLLALRRVRDFFPAERSFVALATLEMARTYRALGDEAMARQALQELEAEFAEQEEARVLAAVENIDMDMAEGRIDSLAAMRALARLLEVHRSQPQLAVPIAMRLGGLQFAAAQYGEALTSYGWVLQQQGADREAAAESQLRIGDCLDALRREEEAERAYALLVDRYPEQETTAAQAMERLLRERQLAGDRLALLRRCREVSSAYRLRMPRVAAFAQLRAAELLLAAGDFEAAQIELAALQSDFPDQRTLVARSRLLLAKAYQDGGDWRKAVSVLQQAQAEFDTVAGGRWAEAARQALFRALMQSGEQLLQAAYFALAAARYRQALEVAPNDIEAHRGYIQAQYYGRAIDQATREYQARLVQHPDDPLLLYCLGLCLSFKATEQAELYGHQGRIDPELLARSNSLLDRALEADYRMVYAYLTKSYNYEMLETYDRLRRSRPQTLPRRVLEAISAPLVSVLRTVTMAKEEAQVGNYERAIDALTIALGLNDENENPKLEARLCRNLANNYYNLAEFGYQKAYEYYHLALRFDSTFASRRDEAVMMERMGHCALVVEDFERGPTYLRRAIDLYRDLGREELVLLNIKRLAMLYQMAEDYLSAAEYFEQAVAMETRRGNLGEVQRLHRNLAYNYWLLGEPTDAYTHAIRARDLLDSGKLKEAKGTSSRIQVGVLGWYVPIPFVDLSKMGAIGGSAAFGFTTVEERALVYTILGNILVETKRYEEAIRENVKKLALYRKRKDVRAEAAVLNNLGYLQLLKGDPLGAWQQCERSYDLCLKQKVVAGVVVNAINLGQLALLLSDPALCDAAATRLDRALSFTEGQSRVLVQRRAQLLNLLGALTLEHQAQRAAEADFQDSLRHTVEIFQRAGYAQTYFEEALNLSLRRRLPREEALSRMNLARCWAVLGEWEHAALHLLQARRLCQTRGYGDLLWQVNQGLAELADRLDERARTDLRLSPPRVYFAEALTELRAASEAGITRLVLPMERSRHRQLYEEYAFHLATIGDTLGALQAAEELRAQAFLDATSGEAIRLSSPTRTNLLNWVRTFREELTASELKVRQLSAVLQRNAPELIRWRAAQDSLRREYEQALARLRQEAPALEALVTVHSPSLAAVQHALEGDEVALAFLVGARHTLLWAVTPRRVAMFRIPTGAEGIRQLTEGFLKSSPDDSSRQMIARLFMPAAGLLRRARRAIIVPDGFLFRLPMQAAVLASLGQEAPAVTVCSSLSSYVLAANRRTVGGPVVFLADTLLQHPLQELGYEVVSLPRLPGKETQAREVSQVLLGSNIVHWRATWQWQETAPLHSALQLADGQGGFTLRLLDLFEVISNATVCVIDGGETAAYGSAAQLVDRLLALSGSAAGLLVGDETSPEARLTFYEAFYRQLLEKPPAEAFRAAVQAAIKKGMGNLSAQLVGYGGMSRVEASTYAERALAGKVRAGLQAEQDKDWGDAVRFYEEALAMATARQDSASIQRLRLLIVRASASGGLVRKTIQYQRLLAAEADRKGDPQLQVRRSRNLASLYAQAEDYAAAIAAMEHVREVASSSQEQLLPELHRELGIVHERAGHYQAALEQYEASRALYAAAGASEGQALNLSDMGRVALRYLEDYPLALQHLSAGLALLEAQGPSATLVEVLNNLGLAHEMMADYRAAVDAQRRAREQAERLKLPDKVALCEHYLANLAWKMGDYQEALQHNRRALQAFEKQGDLSLQALALATRGLIQLSIGNAPQALRDQHNALEIAIRTGELLDQATIRKNIGLVHVTLGEYEKALVEFTAAAHLDSTIGRQRGLSYDLRNMGALLLQKGQLTGADESLRAALTLSKEVGDRRNEAQCLYYIGAVRRAQRNREQAVLYLEQAAALARSLFVPEVEWRALHQLGLLQREARRLEESRASLLQAVQVVEQMRARIKVAEHQAGFINDKQEVYADLIDLLIEMGRDEEAFAIAERARSRGFLDMLGNRQLAFGARTSQELYDALTGVEAQMRNVQEEIARLRSVEPEQASAAQKERLQQLSAELTKLRSTYESQLIRLKESDPRLADMVTVDPWPPSRVQALLPPGVAVVEYFVGKDRLFIWLVTSATLKAWATPLGQEELYKEVGQVRQAISQLSTVRQRSARLWQALIAPAAPSLQGVSTLVIIPHGPLHYLPFACLVDPQGRYLIETFSLATAPSGTVLGMCMEGGSRFLSTPRQEFRVLALGNPTLPGQPRPLPMAAKEVESISRSFAKVDKFLGTSATETVVKAAQSPYDVYLFSCHGEYDSANPLFSSLLLAPDKENDGRLEAREVFSLRLESYLVAMSACETALSSIAGGDEIIGLTRSFVFAGASSLFASLWKVDDLATAVMVKRFVRYLAEGESRARALQRAQLLVMSEVNAHPAYWAAFQLIGDFR